MSSRSSRAQLSEVAVDIVRIGAMSVYIIINNNEKTAFSRSLIEGYSHSYDRWWIVNIDHIQLAEFFGGNGQTFWQQVQEWVYTITYNQAIALLAEYGVPDDRH